MNRENASQRLNEIRQEIRSSWRRIIPAYTSEAQTKANRETSWVCPICGHGAHGDGLTFNPRSKDGNGLKCFACDFSGDIMDLIQQVTGGDHKAAMQAAAAEIGITDDIPALMYAALRDPLQEARRDFAQNAPGSPVTPHRADERPRAGKSSADGEKAFTGQNKGNSDELTPSADYRQYYRECASRIYTPAAVAYLQQRGLSPETVQPFFIGFDPAADPAGNPGGMNGYSAHPCPRIIIPTTAGHYIGRSIDPDTAAQYRKMNPKGSTPGIFNERALYDDAAQAGGLVFIAEGAFDALSIIEAGAQAIALNSTSNADRFIKQLEGKPTAATLILALDNDEKGRKAAQTLRDGLTRLNVTHVTADICAKYKDPNEALTADKKGFCDALNAARAKAAAKPDNTTAYIDLLMAGEIDRFKEAAQLKTGFPNLDEQARGLYPGLYVVAAISSLGKTTFTHQIMDNIAASGNDVIFFSLEQSRLELVSKSLARMTAQADISKAVSSLSIRRGYLPEQVLTAAEEYKRRTGDRFSIVEGNFNCNIAFIGDYLRQYIRRTGCKPVVCIDYLQILQGDPDKRQTTKETIDNGVTELKRISRELDLTVFVISSVNRANYLTPIDFESLKESGSIEFTADVVWGLQLQCLNSDPIFEKEGSIKKKREAVKVAKSATPRQIELVCLKNRYGIASYSCFFDYYPANDLFIPADGLTAIDTPKMAATTWNGKKGRK